MISADDQYRICLSHAATPRKQFTAQHSGDGHQRQYPHGEAGSLLAVVDCIGECSIMGMHRGATSPARTGRMGRYRSRVDRSLWRVAGRLLRHCWRFGRAGRGGIKSLELSDGKPIMQSYDNAITLFQGNSK